MKISILLFVLICSLSGSVYSQNSVGFSDPDNIQPLLDYRLPEWGYNELFLDLNIDGVFTTDYGDDNTSSDNDFSSQFAPAYNWFRESE